MRGTREGSFRVQYHVYIISKCTQLGNEFLVTFYTPRNSNASAPVLGLTNNNDQDFAVFK